MQFCDRLLLENRAWADEMRGRDPDYFSRLQHGQAPEALWIGCSDSRVPPEQLCNATAGELFIHRNVANLVASEDLGFMSVLEYAVVQLAVPNIVVCGHHGCGGVGAACSSEKTPLMHVEKHIEPLRALYRRHGESLAAIESSQARVDKLVELNVVAQIDQLAALSVVRNAPQPPTLYGLVYAFGTGELAFLSRRKPEPGQATETALSA